MVYQLFKTDISHLIKKKIFFNEMGVKILGPKMTDTVLGWNAP